MKIGVLATTVFILWLLFNVGYILVSYQETEMENSAQTVTILLLAGLVLAGVTRGLIIRRLDATIVAAIATYFVGVATSALAGAIAYGNVFPHSPFWHAVSQADLGEDTYAGLAFLSVQTTAEESFFTGGLYGGMRRLMPPIVAKVIGGFIFSIFHSYAYLGLPILAMFNPKNWLQPQAALFLSTWLTFLVKAVLLDLSGSFAGQAMGHWLHNLTAAVANRVIVLGRVATPLVFALGGV